MLFKQRMLYSGDFHIKKAIIRLFFAETGRKKHTDDDIKQEELPDEQELEKGAITGFALAGQLRKTTGNPLSRLPSFFKYSSKLNVKYVLLQSY